MVSELMQAIFQLSREDNYPAHSFYSVILWAKNRELIDERESSNLTAWVDNLKENRSYFFDEFSKRFPLRV